MLHELVTITSPPLALQAASRAAHEWVLTGAGELLGAWRTEFGELFQIKLLRRYASIDALDGERMRTLSSATPYGIDDPTVRLQLERYERFPFLPDIVPGEFGRFYEFRTYFLKPGGLPPTLAGWKAAIVPAHDYTKHLVINMYALDGLPRITHIWGFSSLEQRAKLRERHYGNGSWPPKGAPGQIASATSTLCTPEPYSPLR